MANRIDPASAPLVTIGIPTYNRPQTLRRAIESARSQDAAPVEILVSDNASEDPEVERVGRAAATADPRVTYIRQPSNAGHAANFQWVLEHARGELFMWLADDDWIDPGYVAACRGALLGDPRAILVCGLGRYYVGGQQVLDERAIDLVADDPARRILAYFARVSFNGPMSGVARRADLLRVGFPATLGGDWLLIASLARQGRVITLPDVHVHRSMTGLGSDPDALVGDLGLRRGTPRGHHVPIAAQMWREAVAGRLAVPGSRSRRLAHATAIAGLILLRFTIADLVRSALGARAAALEARVSTWLRRRDVAR